MKVLASKSSLLILLEFQLSNTHLIRITLKKKLVNIKRKENRTNARRKTIISDSTWVCRRSHCCYIRSPY